jgi:hypothetical protein
MHESDDERIDGAERLRRSRAALDAILDAIRTIFAAEVSFGKVKVRTQRGAELSAAGRRLLTAWRPLSWPLHELPWSSALRSELRGQVRQVEIAIHRAASWHEARSCRDDFLLKARIVRGFCSLNQLPTRGCEGAQVMHGHPVAACVWRWARLRRLAPLAGRLGLWVKLLLADTYRPGGVGAKRSRDEFEQLAGMTARADEEVPLGWTG